jgi:mono/diheme cytochrome c family protein
VDLTRDYLSAKGNEPYAGIPTAFLRATAGFTLENFVGRSQPLLFDSVQISNERWHFVDGAYLPEPTRSPTWDQAYAAFQRGEQLALPHYDPRPTDAHKQALLTAAYQRYSSGEISADALPDLADIFPDDPERRAEIGLQTSPAASTAEILVQACGSCHNDVLDQTISRARFNIDLQRMDRAELEIAIQRLNAPAGAPGRMPPPESRQLDPAAQQRLIAYLQQSARSATDDALLERAATLGMAGGRQ